LAFLFSRACDAETSVVYRFRQFLLSACAVVTVADAAVSVVATTVKVGATVVGTTVDVAAAGVRVVTPDGDEKK